MPSKVGLVQPKGERGEESLHLLGWQRLGRRVGCVALGTCLTLALARVLSCF